MLLLPENCISSRVASLYASVAFRPDQFSLPVPSHRANGVCVSHNQETDSVVLLHSVDPEGVEPSSCHLTVKATTRLFGFSVRQRSCYQSPLPSAFRVCRST